MLQISVTITARQQTKSHYAHTYVVLELSASKKDARLLRLKVLYQACRYQI